MVTDFFLFCAWLISAGCAIIFPLIRWKASRSKYYAYYGRYNAYEQQQRAYEQQQQYNNYNNQQYQYNGQYGYQQCKWYQWSCRKSVNNWYYYQQASGDGNGQAFYAPNWYRMINGKMEGDEREREEMGVDASEASGTLKFIYVWTLLMFIGLVLFGTLVIWKRNPGGPAALFVMLVFFGQMALLQLLLLGQGVIVTDMRDMEDSIYGWYGQMGVLMAYANFWYIIFSFGFAILFGILSCWTSRVSHRQSSIHSEENGSSWTTRNSKAVDGVEGSGGATTNNMMGAISGAGIAAAAYIGSLMARYRKQDLSTQEHLNSSYTVPVVQQTTPYPSSTTNGSSMRSVQNASMRSVHSTHTTATSDYNQMSSSSCLDIGDQIADITTTGPPSLNSSVRADGNLAL